MIAARDNIDVVGSLLSAASPLLEPEQAVRVAKDHYGLCVTAHRLSGEKDSNFRVTTSLGEEYLLKAVNPSEDAGVTNMHTMALLHVAESDPSLPIQRVLKTLSGQPEFRLNCGVADVRTVRMVSFTQGRLQKTTNQTAAQRRNAGRMLARLQLALVRFSHPAESHFLTWDLKQAGALRALLPDIPDRAHRLELGAWLTKFEAEVAPLMGSLRTQVVHNDLNSDNIVVDAEDTDRIVGIIDFGDMVKTPVVFDAAVGAAYQLTDAADPLDAACDFLAGFNAVRPLTEMEIGVMYTTIMARMVMRIAITEWRSTRFPENQAYILRNTPKAWEQFHRLARIQPIEATNRIAASLRT